MEQTTRVLLILIDSRFDKIYKNVIKIDLQTNYSAHLSLFSTAAVVVDTNCKSIKSQINTFKTFNKSATWSHLLYLRFMNDHHHSDHMTTIIKSF